MIAYTVHEPSEPARDPLARADDVVFVKEGFSWLALLIPYFWLIAQRMWIVLAGFVGLILAITGLIIALGANEGTMTWASFGLGLVLAIQANDLRRWSLERRGFEMVAVVTGRSRDECEMKFFSSLLENVPAAAPEKAPTTPAPASGETPAP